MNDHTVTSNQSVTEVKSNHIETSFSKEMIKSEMEQYGLSGLEFDYASFPVICLKGSTFEMNDDPDFNPNSFNVTVIKTNEKYVVTDASDNNFQGVKYSSDGVVTNDGEPLADIVAKLMEEGRNPIVKRYLDILVQLHTDDKHNKKLAVLSISPISVSRVSGFFYQLRLQGQLTQLKDLIMTVSKGQMRTSKGGHNYRIWKFELNQSLSQVA